MIGSAASASGLPPRFCPPSRAPPSRFAPSIDSPRSWRSHISSSGATLCIAYASPTTPSRRSAVPYGSAASTSRGIVSQYDVVCICCSGSSSSPDPTFSFV